MRSYSEQKITIDKDAKLAEELQMRELVQSGVLSNDDSIDDPWIVKKGAQYLDQNMHDLIKLPESHLQDDKCNDEKLIEGKILPPKQSQVFKKRKQGAFFEAYEKQQAEFRFIDAYLEQTGLGQQPNDELQPMKKWKR